MKAIDKRSPLGWRVIQAQGMPTVLVENARAFHSASWCQEITIYAPDGIHILAYVIYDLDALGGTQAYDVPWPPGTGPSGPVPMGAL